MPPLCEQSCSNASASASSRADTTVRRASGLAVGLLAGAAADAMLADPRRAHPVAAFGRAAETLEKLVYRDSRAAGVGFGIACVGAAVGAGVVAERMCRGRASYPLLVSICTWM